MATIAENLQEIIDIKSDIKTAIENKGVDMTNTTFGEYASKIGEITPSIIINCEKINSLEDCWRDISVGSVTLLNTDNVTNTSHTFYNSGLFSLSIGNTSNVTNMSNMFYGCRSLTTIPELDTSNVTNMSNMFNGCRSLTTVTQLNTSNVTNMSYIFYGCRSLTTVPTLNLSKVTTIYREFTDCEELHTIGGLVDLGKSFNANFPENLRLNDSPKLTYQSCINIFNSIYDMNLITNYGNLCKIYFHTTTYSLLSDDDIAIATNKGWTVTT